MALQMNVTFRGLGIANAYHRIVAVDANRQRNSNVILISIYPSKAVADAGEQPFDIGTAVVPFDNTMDYAGAYAHLKAMEAFASSIDV
jgi:hypothetical protein